MSISFDKQMVANHDYSTTNVSFTGLIFETEIVSGEDGRFFHASLEQYVKPVS